MRNEISVIETKSVIDLFNINYSESQLRKVYFSGA